MHPLEGTLVVALEHAVSAPLATRHLADLGARVVKVERPGVGDFARGYDRVVHGQSSWFVWLNRGKESVELDLKDAADRALLERVVDAADVVVQNLAPGAAERLGLDAATLRARRPRLVHCSISGYGSEGPDRARKAYDLLLQCETGLVEVTGTPDTPAKVGISVADIATGVYAFSGVLAALYERERTGAGSTLEVSMLDALGEWMTQPVYWATYGGRAPRRTGARHASIAPYGPYRVGDGGSVFLGVQNDREWAVLCREVLGRPDLVDDARFARAPERLAHDGAITELLEAAFAGLDADRVVALLDAAGIACARLRTPAQFAGHPALLARDRWREVGTPGGPVRALVPPVTVRGREPLVRDVPALGRDTAALRREFAGPPADVEPDLNDGAWPADVPPLAEAEPVTGGWVGRTRRGRLADGRAVVVKHTPYPAEVEADGLRALDAAGVPVPEVLGVAGRTLVLALVTGEPDWAGLGRAVARMHRTSGPAYGWHRDNCAGRFPQENGWLGSWGEFYAERRVRAHLADPAVPADLRDRLARACDGPLPRLLPAHPTPSLTHGDLWAGNVVDGRWLVDPEVSYADRELDVAYTQGSSSLPPEFWAAYERAWPLDPGFAARRDALRLHHMLLQVRHFGVERYRPRIEAVLDSYGW